MEAFFLSILNMSISASWIVLAVLLLRVLLKKAPRWITVLLWGIVAIRLICPFTIESALSLIPSKEPIRPEILVEQGPVTNPSIPVIDGEEPPAMNGTANPGINGTDTPVLGEPVSPTPDIAPTNPVQTVIKVLSYVWLTGMAGMLAYTVISYFRVKAKIGTAVRLRDHIFQSESVVSPFVLGLIKPKIYLSFCIDGQDMEYVIAHENAHIRRKDHWWKPVGFLILTLHWFNPLLWLGYVLLCRDIELACDEKVIKELDFQQKADYSQALLNCSVNRRILAACPLAFGEVGVKNRVKSVLNYKKPAFWIIAVAIVASIVTAVCFLTDPVDKNPNPDDVTNQTAERFLKGEISATDKDGRKVSIQDYIRGDYNKYALYDMSGDAVPELIIRTGNGLTIFSIKEQELTVWYQGTVYEKPLNNRAIFYERPGGAPEHTDYQYIVLSHNGEETQRTSFSEYPGNNPEYFINGEKVSKADYEALYKSFDLSDDGIVWKDILSTPNQSTAYDRAITAYNAFLNGQIAAIAEDNSKIFVSSYSSISNGQSGFDRYALHDVNGDGIPELFIDASHDHILAFDGENVRQWYSSMSWMGIQLLSSGAVVDTHSGAGSFINYLTFGPDGIEKFISFSGGPGGESGQYYYGEGRLGSSKEVSKDQWEALTRPYFQQMENKAELEWHTTIPTTPNSGAQVYPTITFQVNSSRPEYTAVVNYNIGNSGIAQSVTIWNPAAKKYIQTISLSGNELFAEKVLYAVDVTFDGNLDILIPYQQPASAAYFQAYVWQESEGKFLYAPQFENLPNFVIDQTNGRILSTRTASQITSYGISYYDAEAKDFRPSHSIYWEPDAGGSKMHFVEQQYKNSTAVTVKDCLVEKTGNMDVNKSDPQIAEYFASNSFWDLDNQRWKNQFYKPSQNGAIESIEDLSSLPLDEAYDYALRHYMAGPSSQYRDVGKLQPETQQIVAISGKYYQSYVASNVDIRYIWISQSEFPDNNTALWDWCTVGSSQVYSLDLLGKIDEGRSGNQTDKIDVADIGLLSVLYNKSPFITQKGITVDLNAYKPLYKCPEDTAYYEEENVFVPRDYTFVDLDEDGNRELVVAEAPYADTYLILREEKGNVYGYSLPIRQFQSLKQDGSFQGSSGALINDYCTISFSQNTYQVSTIAKFYFEGDAEKAVFEIDGKQVSYEEIRQFAEQWKDRPSAKWIVFGGTK